MAQEQQSAFTEELTVQNVGGITETKVAFSPGVTVLSGRNATNRTSLLQALMAALGSERASLKADADRGRVELSIGDDTFTRSLTRENGSITFDGDPYLDRDEAELADLFAFQLESNEARRAVEQDEDLRELIMQPVDTEAIQAEIRELEEEKRRLGEKIEELNRLERNLPKLEKEGARLEQEIADKRKELEEKEAEIEAADVDVDQTRDEGPELDGKLEELRNTRSALEDTRLDIDAEEKSLDALRDERDELEDELAELSGEPDADIDTIEGEIERLRNRRQDIDTTLNELQTVIQFNEEMLEGTSTEVASVLRAEGEGEIDESITDQLIENGEQVVCWTCGSNVDTRQIEATVDRLRQLRQEKLNERNEQKKEIEEFEARKREHEETQRRHERLRRRTREVEDEIESREANLSKLRQRRDDLEQEIERLEQTVEDLETEENDELLEIHKEANQIEFELGRLQSDLDDTNAEIESIESRLGRLNSLESDLDEVRKDLEDLRSRIERIEENAVTRFNDHMGAVLDILDYDNIERIWIEGVEKEVREGRRKVSRPAFNLHIVRSTESGATYEDTINHLSESEREVTGLIFALAGYLVHDVYETVPFILLDSLEAIDSQRIASLVDYLAEYADYLVVALLPEDASALDADYNRITEI